MAKSRVGSKEEDMGGIMGPQFTLLATQAKIIQVRLNFLKKFGGTNRSNLKKRGIYQTVSWYQTRSLFGEQFMITVCMFEG